MLHTPIIPIKVKYLLHFFLLAMFNQLYSSTNQELFEKQKLK